MAGRKKEETILMESEAWRLRTKHGMTHQAITDELNRTHFADRPYTRTAITKGLNRTSKRYAQDQDEYIKRYKVEHTEVLEHMVSDLMEAIQKSKGASKKAIKTTRKAAGKEGDTPKIPFEETRIETEDRYLDTDLIRALQGVLNDIREIWGANAPTETINTLRGGIISGHTEVDELTDEQLRNIIAGKP